MILNKTDYVLERTPEGRYYAHLKATRQIKGYGSTPEEAVRNLKRSVEDMVSEMYMVEDYV